MLLLIAAVLSLTAFTSSQLKKKYEPLVFEILPDSSCLNGKWFKYTQHPSIKLIEKLSGYKGKKKRIGVYKIPYYQLSRHNIIFETTSTYEMADAIQIFFDPSYKHDTRVKQSSNIILKINGNTITKETTKADLESYLSSTIVNGRPKDTNGRKSYICNTVKGISYIPNPKNRRTALVIDLKVFKKQREDIEDLLDGLIAESRKDEERVPIQTVIKSLKKKGKL
jgi:hypothetical protein